MGLQPRAASSPSRAATAARRRSRSSSGRRTGTASRSSSTWSTTTSGRPTSTCGGSTAGARTEAAASTSTRTGAADAVGRHPARLRPPGGPPVHPRQRPDVGRGLPRRRPALRHDARTSAGRATTARRTSPDGLEPAPWINAEIREGSPGRSPSPRTCRTTTGSQRTARAARASARSGTPVRPPGPRGDHRGRRRLPLYAAVRGRDRAPLQRDASGGSIYTETHDEVANGKAGCPGDLAGRRRQLVPAEALDARRRARLLPRRASR